tara:strand:+ start:1060 stop:1461 length:402 start_codon:yes stop_codon:yes gene_type:complete
MAALKGSAMFKRRLRSPFWGATRHDLAMIREAVIAVYIWEHTIPHEVVDWPDARYSDVPNNVRELFRLESYIERARNRALERMYVREDYPTIFRNQEHARVRSNDPAGYEAQMLRRELAELKQSLSASGHIPS